MRRPSPADDMMHDHPTSPVLETGSVRPTFVGDFLIGMVRNGSGMEPTTCASRIYYTPDKPTNPLCCLRISVILHRRTRQFEQRRVEILPDGVVVAVQDRLPLIAASASDDVHGGSLYLG